MPKVSKENEFLLKSIEESKLEIGDIVKLKHFNILMIISYFGRSQDNTAGKITEGVIARCKFMKSNGEFIEDTFDIRNLVKVIDC